MIFAHILDTCLDIIHDGRKWMVTPFISNEVSSSGPLRTPGL